MDSQNPKNTYFWRQLEIGESHYKHRRKLDQVRSAWNNFKRNNPDMRKRVVEFSERQNGVAYRRVE